MNLSRRRFMQLSAAAASGFAGLHLLVSGNVKAVEPYGPLESDPDKYLDLPKGFSYKVISRRGEVMDDGLLLPDLPDGMAAFEGPDGLTLLVRNHELTPVQRGPFGKGNELLGKISKDKLYDRGNGETPGAGGTTTVVYDTKKQKVVRQFLSLAGTSRNCSGGPSPWGSWLTCEETVDRAGVNAKGKYVCERDHGYVFEVPASEKIGLADPIPLKDMGRFNHEAVAVDPQTSIVYLTEDRDDGLFYRFIPKKKRKLAEGGKLQVLALRDHKSADTRNWNKEAKQFKAGEKHKVEWLEIDDVQSSNDDLRKRGFESGAARFARGEGIWFGKNEFFFACTSGGRERAGQVWRYGPVSDTLQLFVEPNDIDLLKSADNLTLAPWGDLILCEDRTDQVVRLVGVTPKGELYTFAHNHLRTEFAGATFSPDGTTLFVNIQGKGITVAITGPWNERRLA